MPGYRLSFGTLDMRVNDMADALLSAERTMGEVMSPLGETTEVLSNDYFASPSSNQFVIRFAAPDDETASAVAVVALREVSVPIDGERIERRSRRYVQV